MWNFSETPARPEVIKVVTWSNLSWIKIYKVVSEKLHAHLRFAVQRCLMAPDLP